MSVTPRSRGDLDVPRKVTFVYPVLVSPRIIPTRFTNSTGNPAITPMCSRQLAPEWVVAAPQIAKHMFSQLYFYAPIVTFAANRTNHNEKHRQIHTTLFHRDQTEREIAENTPPQQRASPQGTCMSLHKTSTDGSTTRRVSPKARLPLTRNSRRLPRESGPLISVKVERFACLYVRPPSAVFHQNHPNPFHQQHWKSRDCPNVFIYGSRCIDFN